jgi:hypothetical protein
MVTMDNIIDKFQVLYSEIKKEKGSFYLFVVLKINEYADKWSVVVSAPWMSGQNQKDNFNYIAQKITSILSKEEISTIARVGLFRSDEHLVDLFTKTIQVEGTGAVHLENTKINGYQIHDAYVFESRRDTSLQN